jgi:hypothetical protein
MKRAAGDGVVSALIFFLLIAYMPASFVPKLEKPVLHGDL